MVQERTTKQCPYCGEEISINAKKCKHCGEWLTEKPIVHQFAQPVEQPTYQPAPQQQFAQPVEQPTYQPAPQQQFAQPVEQPTYQPAPQQQVIVTQVEHRSNGVGTAGFVIALICACLSWLPGVNVFLWFIGLLLSFIGMFKRPRGLAVVGFFISIIDIIIIVAILGAIGGALSGILN